MSSRCARTRACFFHFAHMVCLGLCLCLLYRKSLSSFSNCALYVNLRAGCMLCRKIPQPRGLYDVIPFNMGTHECSRSATRCTLLLEQFLIFDDIFIRSTHMCIYWIWHKSCNCMCVHRAFIQRLNFMKFYIWILWARKLLHVSSHILVCVCMWKSQSLQTKFELNDIYSKVWPIFNLPH